MRLSNPTIGSLPPAFAAEFEELLRQVDRADLVSQVRDLPVLGRCDCRDDNCVYFYTAANPVGPYGLTHSNALLPSAEGIVILNLLGDRIVAVPILDRPDIKVVLDRPVKSRARCLTAHR